eukprot:CAMPEP_0196144288 /NCGR_PEP_ID=MMETSP0910-20130528/15772_1 /TAXON_ID=49265 /ORGANISM="Thalassiosira rotula, Strain GSO102" /LENGTH=31 /DNA_ID= /DNA_START= /DNA_END= /DNA_ORIENTATION=
MVYSGCTPVCGNGFFFIALLLLDSIMLTSAT